MNRRMAKQWHEGTVQHTEVEIGECLPADYYRDDGSGVYRFEVKPTIEQRRQGVTFAPHIVEFVRQEDGVWLRTQ